MGAFHTEARNDGLRVVARSGSNSVLLGISLDDDHVDARDNNLAGFAIWRTLEGKPEEPLVNRLTFQASSGVPTPTYSAPIQRFRWTDVPPGGLDRPVSYRVQAFYFTGQGTETRGGPQLRTTTLTPGAQSGPLRVAFTRGYLGGQGYVDQFANQDIRPAGSKTASFDTKPFERQYQWLGGSARRQLFDFLADCDNDKQSRIDVFAHHLDEPDLIAALCRFGKQGRLRVILDDAKPSAAEVAAAKQIIAAAGLANVKLGHFGRFQNYRAIIHRKSDGAPKAVLFGSIDFSLRGLYVQPNNVFVSAIPGIVRPFAEAFHVAFASDVKAGTFARAAIARGWMTATAERTGPQLAFGPYLRPGISLDLVARAIRTARSSVLFSVSGFTGRSPVLATLQEAAGRPSLFTYGTVQTAKGLAVQEPIGTMSGLVDPAQLKAGVPPALQVEWHFSPGERFDQKFIVIDFDTPSPLVFTGSSDFDVNGALRDGHNLVLTRDPAIATMFAVEAIRQIDRYRFRAAMRSRLRSLSAAVRSEPGLWHPRVSDRPPWWRSYYEPGEVARHDRLLFAALPTEGIQSHKYPDWTTLPSFKAEGREQRTLTPLPSSGEVLETLEGATPTVPRPRYANAVLFAARGNRPLPKRKSVAPAQVLRLRLDIGPLSRQSQVENPVVIPDIVQRKAELDVMVSSTDFDVGGSVASFAKRRASRVAHGRFLLPADGNRGLTPEGERHLTFYLRAPRKRGIARCRIGYYFRNALVQSQLLRATVGGTGGFSIHTDFTLSESLADLEQIPERPRLSMLTNSNGDGQHQIVTRHAGDAPAIDAVQGRTCVLRETAVGPAIIKLRSKLTELAPTKKKRSRGELIEDLKALAPLGRSLYVRVGAALKDALAAWPCEDKLPVIQVLRPDTSSFVLPWGLCYDIALDSQKPSVLCPLVDKWDETEPLFEGSPETCPHEHPPGNVLCPFGFLGFRYAIEQLSKTDKPMLTIASAPRCDFALAETQYQLPDPRALEKHVATLREIAAGAIPPAQVTEAKTRDAVQAMLGRDLSLVYFFCHGNRPKAGDPNTYLAVGNDEPITAEDFTSWVDAWTQQSKRPIWGDVRPLIFVNACHSLAIEPETLVSYLDAFVTWGHAAGVIGTEVKISQILAMDVAEQFFRRLLARTHSVEQALREIRLDYLARGNLFGLVYTPYCWGDLRLG